MRKPTKVPPADLPDGVETGKPEPDAETFSGGTGNPPAPPPPPPPPGQGGGNEVGGGG